MVVDAHVDCVVLGLKDAMVTFMGFRVVLMLMLSFAIFTRRALCSVMNNCHVICGSTFLDIVFVVRNS